MFSKIADQWTLRRKRVLESGLTQYQYFTHLLGHIWTKRSTEFTLKLNIEEEFKKRFNYTDTTSEEEFNSLHQHVPLEEIYQQFLQVEAMEELQIDLLSPVSKNQAKKQRKNRIQREKLAIANILSPERMASKRKCNRDAQAQRRSAPDQRERYNAAQAQLQAQQRSDPDQREQYNAAQTQLQAQQRSNPDQRERYNAAQTQFQAQQRSDPDRRERYNAAQTQFQAQQRSDPIQRERYNAAQAQLQAQQRSDPNQRELYNAAQIHLYQQSKANRNSNLCERAILQADEDGGWEETKETHHISSVHETQTSSVADPKEMDRVSSVGDDCNSDEIHDIGLSQHNFPAHPRIVPINLRLPGIAAKYNIDDPEFF